MSKCKINLAILICKKYYSTPTSVDNNLFLSALDNANLRYELVVWDTDNIYWEKYSAVLIRATWDYIEGKRDKFIKTLEEIAKLKIPIFNSLETVIWNSKKNYLLDLQKKSIKIIDTLITTHNKMNNLSQFMSLTNAEEYVIKPIISGGAFNTHRVKSTDILQTTYKHFQKDEEILIQPLMSEILNEGEWSLIFFDGLFSHSVLLKPASGDFRVQLKHGGAAQIIQAPETMIETAKEILSVVEGGNPIYARLDFIRKHNQAFLMELELIEPALFFRWDTRSASRFVEVLLHRLCH